MFILAPFCSVICENIESHILETTPGISSLETKRVIKQSVFPVIKMDEERKSRKLAHTKTIKSLPKPDVSDKRVVDIDRVRDVKPVKNIKKVRRKKEKPSTHLELFNKTLQPTIHLIKTGKVEEVRHLVTLV